MCGLIALISKSTKPLTQTALELFINSLTVGVLRGRDSTGLFIITTEGNVHTLKQASNSTHFLENHKTKEFFDLHSDNILAIIGHNRAATKGKVSDETAHPFIHNNTVLVHNGTLWNHKALADVVVDSEAICQAISKTSYKDTLPKLDGAFALIWYDAENKEILVTRNDERSLWIFETQEFDYLCSELNMGNWLLPRTYKFQKEPVGKYFKELSVYKWNLSELYKGYDICHSYTECKKDFFFPKNTQHYTAGFGTTTKKLTQNDRLLKNCSIQRNTLIQVYIISVDIISDDQVKITGYHSKYPNITFIYYLKVPKDEVKSLILQTTIIGTAFGGKEDGDIIYLHKPTTKTITGINNIPVQIDEHSTCYKCGVPITEDDDKQVFVRVKQNESKIMCPNCVEIIPQLKERYVHIQ